MASVSNRTIEDRLDEIEHGVHEIRALLLKLTVTKGIVAEKLADEFMNVKELAIFAKVDPAAIYNACAKHELKFFKLGKLYKFKREHVLQWLDADRSGGEVNVDEFVEKYLQKHVIKG